MAIDPGTESLLAAAAHWRDRCLLGEGSVFSEERLWTWEHLGEMNRYFVENLDTGTGTFLEKLQAQLAPASPYTKRLAAEMLWLLLLFPNNIGRDTKVNQVAVVWEWSGEPFPRDHDMVDAPLARGVGSGGMAFNNLRWAELAFLVVLMRDWRRREREEQEHLLADPWRFAGWLDGIPGAQNRQFRHMLLHLLFPETFERISSGTHKRWVDQAFAGELQALGADVPVGTDLVTRDRRLLLLRGALEGKHPDQQVDFYLTPWWGMWHPQQEGDGDGPDEAPTPVPSVVKPLEEEPPYTAPAWDEIVAAIGRQGIRIDERTLRRYHLALGTRGFVVLAGVSGTGKTWLAEAYARALGARYLVVPVAPNWTTNEDLLGYVNPLDGQYHDTPFSRFLRAAAAEYLAASERERAPRPFHLVLDEMNLARVEYYFARFLSAMELRARDGTAAIELAPDDEVLLPPNLLFIGTVNVDETTHGFADKVYDRAQLVELEASREAMDAHLAGAGHGPALLEVWEAVREVAPFAFRVADEVGKYVAAGQAAGAPADELVDEQLLQKVLPKIRGTDLRVGAALERLEALADGRYPLTHVRVRRMLDSFRQHGFASYF
ncbi:MAG TPA: AAA family ATPase [Longimicrobium sp.]|jgi:MoxR-like ATPase|uniref:McrB family protein n=1 Tax=Longimicrobium sp. TaxID=2029185 RepID=UPI002ED7C262